MILSFRRRHFTRRFVASRRIFDLRDSRPGKRSVWAKLIAFLLLAAAAYAFYRIVLWIFTDFAPFVNAFFSVTTSS